MKTPPETELPFGTEDHEDRNSRRFMSTPTGFVLCLGLPGDDEQDDKNEGHT